MGGPLEEALVRFEVGTRLADLDETRMLRYAETPHNPEPAPAFVLNLPGGDVHNPPDAGE